MPFFFFVLHCTVNAVVVAAYPDGTVGCFTEACNFVDYLRVGLVELIHVVCTDKRILAFIVAVVKVDDTQSCLASHPKASPTVDQRADASSYVEASFKRQQQLFSVEVIEEHSVITAYPKSVVTRVEGKSPDVIQQFIIFLSYIEMIYFLGVVHHHHINSPTP